MAVSAFGFWVAEVGVKGLKAWDHEVDELRASKIRALQGCSSCTVKGSLFFGIAVALRLKVHK